MKRETCTVCRFMFIAFVATGFGVPAASDDGCLEPAGRWPHPFGPATAVAVSGNTAYYGLDRMLVVADVSDPASPVKLGAVEIPERAQDIAVLEDIVYVATYSHGLRIIDASNASSPVEVGEFLPEWGRVYGIDVQGSYVYLAADLDGLIVLDARAPSAPFKRGSIDIHSSVTGFDVVVSGGIAYVAGAKWLMVIGVANPDSPQKITYVSSTADFLAVGDGQLYGLSRGGTYEAPLQVFDIHYPAQIREIASYSIDPAGYGLAYSDGHVFVANEQQVTVYPADSLGSWISITPGLFATTGNALGIAVSDDRAYIASGSSGLQVVDVSTPMEPVEVGLAPTSGASTAVVVSKTRAYTGDCTYRRFTVPAPPCTFRVIDIRPGIEPMELGVLELPEVPVEIGVYQNHAVVLSNDSYRVIDVSDPGGPVEVAKELWAGQTAHGLAVSGDHAFFVMSGYTNGLIVADLSSPASPAWAGIVHGEFHDVAVQNDLAFVVDIAQSGLRVFDVSDPTAPVEIGFGATPKSGGRIVVAAGFAYVTELLPRSGFLNRDPYLWIFDLADPTTPTLVGTYQSTGSFGEGFLDVDVSNGLAYLATHRQDSSAKSVLHPHYGMRVVDVSDPTSPVGLEYLESVGISQRVSAYPNNVILVDGWAGLERFDPSECPGFQPPPTRARISRGRVAP